MKGVLQQQGEDFKKEMKERDRSLLQKLKLSHEAFYNNQFERDSQLLTIMIKREEKRQPNGRNRSRDSKFYTSLYKGISRRSWMTGTRIKGKLNPTSR